MQCTLIKWLTLACQALLPENTHISENKQGASGGRGEDGGRTGLYTVLCTQLLTYLGWHYRPEHMIRMQQDARDTRWHMAYLSMLMRPGVHMGASFS